MNNRNEISYSDSPQHDQQYSIDYLTSFIFFTSLLI